MVQNMDTIEQSSKRIGDIVSVIDSIAFQTNILALNAAVEAARAGEQAQGIVSLTDATNPLESEATQLHNLMVTFRLMANDSAAP
jgi:methyl-accepting chemotaxis protein